MQCIYTTKITDECPDKTCSLFPCHGVDRIIKESYAEIDAEEINKMNENIKESNEICCPENCKGCNGCGESIDLNSLDDLNFQELPFNDVSEHVNNNKGDIEFTCEFCGIYNASKPRCNKCERSN